MADKHYRKIVEALKASDLVNSVEVEDKGDGPTKAAVKVGLFTVTLYFSYHECKIYFEVVQTGSWRLLSPDVDGVLAVMSEVERLNMFIKSVEG